MATLPDPLLAYFAQREAQRAAAVETFLAGLTEYERGLVHDTAVMGYVRGSMHPRGEDIPLDAAIIADVVNACFAHADLYPFVNADFEDRRSIVEYFVQGRQPDGTWEQSSSTSTDIEFAAERLAARRRTHPDFEHRLVRRITSVTIQAARDEEPTQ